MLTVCTEQRTEQGISRRDLLRIGTLGISGLTLSSLMAARSSANTLGSALRDKSVVLLFLQGGPTHIETFDPKMTAPVEYRAMFGEVATGIPGVTLGNHFSRLAAMSDRWSIVRSFVPGSSSHGPASELVASGGNPSKATMGSMFARLAGNNHPSTGMPSNAILVPAAVDEAYKNLSRNPAGSPIPAPWATSTRRSIPVPGARSPRTWC